MDISEASERHVMRKDEGARIKWHRRSKTDETTDIDLMPRETVTEAAGWRILKSWNFRAQGHEDAAAKVAFKLPQELADLADKNSGEVEGRLVYFFTEDPDPQMIPIQKRGCVALTTSLCSEKPVTGSGPDLRIVQAPLPPAKKGVLVLAYWEGPGR